MKKNRLLILFICAVLSPPSFGFAARDYLAADETTAKYRTGVLDPRVGQVPTATADGLKVQPESFLKPLVIFLTEDGADDFVKVKRIHDWITENIAYDNDQFYGLTRGEKPLADFRATCGGFASLFSEMTRLAGLEVLTITGKSRSSFDSVKNQMSAHVWNAVKIRGTWFLVDTTHDSRFSINRGVPGKKSPYRDTQLFISPTAKILENFPDRPEHQFLENPLSFTGFLAKPLVSLRFAALGLAWRGDGIEQIIKEQRKDPADPGSRFFKVIDWIPADDRVVVLELDCPKGVSLFAGLTGSDGKKMEGGAFASVENGRVLCRFSAPASGTFSGYISARKNPDEKLFVKVYEFELRSVRGAGPVLPPPGKLHLLDAAERYGLRVVAQDFENAKGFYFLEVEAPDTTTVYSAIWDGSDQKLETGVEKKVISPSASTLTKIRYQYTLPGSGVFFIKIRVKRSEEKTFNETAALIKLVRT